MAYSPYVSANIISTTVLLFFSWWLYGAFATRTAHISLKETCPVIGPFSCPAEPEFTAGDLDIQHQDLPRRPNEIFGIMQAEARLKEVATELLQSQNLRLASIQSIQTLWAGYGHICHVKAIVQGSDARQSLILKYVTPPTHMKQSQAGPLDEGHIRKILSYQVEQYFYTHLAPQMPKDVAVATCLANINRSTDGSNTIAMVMTDLRDSFPVAGEKRAELNATQVHAALKWLSSFHGFWWSRADDVARVAHVRPPLGHFEKHKNTNLASQSGVWSNGGYTYLATRRKEYDDLKSDSDSEWSSALCEPVKPGEKSIAEKAAALLASSAVRDYHTLIHGDVKSENLFTTIRGDAVAFFDFQYVGLGLGGCDLAKLFTCSVPLTMLVEDEIVSTSSKLEMQPGEERLLRAYHEQLQSRSGEEYAWELFIRHWETALVDWLRFQASWGFWGNSEWLEARVRWILGDEEWLKWLDDALQE